MSLNSPNIEILLVSPQINLQDLASLEVIEEFLKKSSDANFRTLRKFSELESILQTKTKIEQKIPDIIIFDLNIKEIDEAEKAIKSIRSHDLFKLTPVIALLNSLERDHIKKLYDHHISCCIVKPEEKQEFLNVLESLQEFWFGMVRLPINLI